MSEVVSTAGARCPEGWRLFYKMGDIYTVVIETPPAGRDWSSWQAAVDEHKEHINSCKDCHFRIKRVRIQLEEQGKEQQDGLD